MGCADEGFRVIFACREETSGQAFALYRLERREYKPALCLGAFLRELGSTALTVFVEDGPLY